MLSSKTRNFEEFIPEKEVNIEYTKDILNDQISVMNLVLTLFKDLKPNTDGRSFNFTLKDKINTGNFEKLVLKLQSIANCSVIIKGNTLFFV